MKNFSKVEKISEKAIKEAGAAFERVRIKEEKKAEDEILKALTDENI